MKTKVSPVQFVPDMILESLDTTQNTGSEPNLKLAEVSDVGEESLGRKWKTRKKKKVRFEEDFAETCTVIEENTRHQVGRGSPLENVFQEEGLGKHSSKKNRNFGKLFHKRGGGFNRISYLLFRNVTALKKRKIKIRIT